MARWTSLTNLVVLHYREVNVYCLSNYNCSFSMILDFFFQYVSQRCNFFEWTLSLIPFIWYYYWPVYLCLLGSLSVCYVYNVFLMYSSFLYFCTVVLGVLTVHCMGSTCLVLCYQWVHKRAFILVFIFMEIFLCLVCFLHSPLI